MSLENQSPISTVTIPCYWRVLELFMFCVLEDKGIYIITIAPLLSRPGYTVYRININDFTTGFYLRESEGCMELLFVSVLALLDNIVIIP